MTTLLRDGTTVEDPRLDRLPTGHTEHLDKYPLTAATMPSTHESMVMGINWYSNFDRPVLRTIRGHKYYIIGDGDLGRIRGGHATALRNWNVRDAYGWWTYYNQGVEGRCVEFAWLRERSLSNRRRYDITSRWHYWEMQMRDYWQGGSYPGANPQYEGTSVDAGAQVMHQFGAIPSAYRGRPINVDAARGLANPVEGIKVYRWATNWDDVRATLQVPDWLPGVPMLNSWGRSYPRQVLLLDDAGARVQREHGEFCVATDR